MDVNFSLLLSFGNGSLYKTFYRRSLRILTKYRHFMIFVGVELVYNLTFL